MSLLAYRKAKLRFRRLWQNMEGQILQRRLLTGLAVVLHAFVFYSPLGTQLENFAYDSWFRNRPAIPFPNDVVIVALDHRTEDELKISPLAPWPRRYYTALLNSLKEKGVRRVIFDIFFRAEGDEQEDRALAEALHSVDTTIGSFSASETRLDEDGKRYEAYTRKGPIPLFAKSAGRVVRMDVWLRDDDQVVRYISANEGKLDERVPMTYALEGILAKLSPVPEIEDRINYYGPPGFITTYSFVDAIKPEHPEYFRDKIVFVGKHLATSFRRTEEKDTYRVPVPGAQMDGVEIHATIAANLLDQSWIRRLPPGFESVALAITLYLLAYGIISIRLTRAAILLLGSEAAWIFIAYRSFCAGIYLPGATMMFLILPLFFCGVVFLTARALYRSFRQMEKAMGVKLRNP